MAILRKGLVQVYTGEGKGKTTAALGQVWRMLGRGGKVYVCQFLKPADQTTGEALLAERFGDQLTFDRLEESWNMGACDSDPEQAERMYGAIGRKLADIQALVRQGQYDLVILDEIVFCLEKQLARWEDVAAIISERAGHVELVLTGQGADAELIKRADLVTRMENVKHPYERNIGARPGIEY